LPQLAAKLTRLRRQKKTIAFTNGCFDLLHAGHLSYLESIKRRAHVLVVAVNSDASLRRLKGAGRPITPVCERARLVAALKPVDYVVVFQEDTPLRVIRALRPNLLAKGADWKKAQIVGKDFVESSGGRVIQIPFLKGRSTTRILQKLQKGQKRR